MTHLPKRCQILAKLGLLPECSLAEEPGERRYGSSLSSVKLDCSRPGIEPIVGKDLSDRRSDFNAGLTRPYRPRASPQEHLTLSLSLSLDVRLSSKTRYSCLCLTAVARENCQASSRKKVYKARRVPPYSDAAHNKASTSILKIPFCKKVCTQSYVVTRIGSMTGLVMFSDASVHWGTLYEA